MPKSKSKLKTDTNSLMAMFDPAVYDFDLFGHPFTRQIWADKYQFKTSTPDRVTDLSIHDTFQRVASTIYQFDEPVNRDQALEAMETGLWMPGGRVIAGAGTGRSVTLMNCYVNHELADSMESIMDGSKVAALTLQHGGGIGTDFSPLRPTGAIVHGVAAEASGPLPFMDMFDGMSSTIMSAGHRRGAMMGTIIDTHPDLPLFIKAKKEKGRLTNFNISVLISDAFMEAVREDEDWMLHFRVPPLRERPQELTDLDFFDEKGVRQYVYSLHKARDLWEEITRTTFEYSEPGVIFIDRVNDMNNLRYLEWIQCTNPCGEQPLPPNGTCDLGAINLALLVRDPYTSTATFNYDLLRRLCRIGVRFLDNVIEVTGYPLPEQKAEEFLKRRIGLGVSGLADALAQLQLRYGSPAALETTEKIFYTICQASYNASVDLAIERGPFPGYNQEDFLQSNFMQRLDFSVIDRIKEHGIRNGVLLTVAPTGTTSILYGDISSGVEPVFAHEARRAVKQPDGSSITYDTKSFSARFYEHVTGKQELPSYMVTADDLTIDDHVTMQAAIQKYVDASISKTVNCPKEMTYEAFVRVYDLAYSLGCKGCTTYRPSDVRGAVLMKKGDEPRLGTQTLLEPPTTLLPRPDELRGITRKIRWPSLSASLYLTVNYDSNGHPFEVFFSSKDTRHHDWMVATSLMITSLLRKGGDVNFIAEELMAVASFQDTAFIRGPGDTHPQNYTSLIALVGAHLKELLIPQVLTVSETPQAVQTPKLEIKVLKLGSRCPNCGGQDLRRQEGCLVCANCGYSNCG